ncbi:TPA: SOS response-associated peptidase [Legionella feeleii]
MCGRFAIDTDIEKIREQFQINSVDSFAISYNIAPTETAICLVHSTSGLKAVPMRWGFVLGSKKEQKSSLHINARVETVAKKSAFCPSFKARRCLILMSGFFEWRKGIIVKQPYYITRHDKKLMAVAGIWEPYESDPTISLPSCCVLTTKANELVSPLHDRMPCILSDIQQREWMTPKEFISTDLEEIMQDNKTPPLELYPVTTSVNSPLYKKKDAIELIRKS